MIDHILVQRKWQGSVLNSRMYPSADTGSDHQLVSTKVSLKLKAGKRHKVVQRYDAEKLANQRMYQTSIKPL